MALVTVSYQLLHQALPSPDTTICFQYLFTVLTGVRSTLTECFPSTFNLVKKKFSPNKDLKILEYTEQG